MSVVICGRCAEREGISRQMDGGAEPAPCSYCGDETRGREIPRPRPGIILTDAIANIFLVSEDAAGSVVILNLPVTSRRGEGLMPEWPVPAPLSRGHALNLAAWLVATTDGRADFLKLLAEVEPLAAVK